MTTPVGEGLRQAWGDACNERDTALVRLRLVHQALMGRDGDTNSDVLKRVRDTLGITSGEQTETAGEGRVFEMKIPKTWNPKRLGVQKSPNAPGLETDVWCYIAGGKLSIIISVSKDGIVLGQTAYHDAARLPR